MRPRLARAALVPSRVFDDGTAWASRGDGWRAFDLAGYASGGGYRIGVRDEAPPAAVPGQYRGRVHLRRVDGGRFEWSVSEELAVGPVRPSDLARALDALRPKLARAALVPSRVFDDASAWTTRGEGWRAVELAGYASGAAYRIEQFQEIREEVLYCPERDP